MGSAATHAHGAAAKVSSATPTAEVRATTTATATAEVRAAATSAAKMSTTATATAETAASRVSSRRQTKGYGYCGCARRDFPHDMTSSSGPNVLVNARSPGTVPADLKSVCCNAHVAQCTSHIIADVRNLAGALGLCGLNFFHTRSRSQE
jgi:hypothetical protein